MFRFSIATTMMSVITTSLLMVILTLCLTNRKLLIEIGYRLLAFFVLFTTLRYALPFDFSFTMTIPLPIELSNIIASLHHDLFWVKGHPVSAWMIFKSVWLLGAVLCILYYTFTYLKANYNITLSGKELTQVSPYKELVDRICKEQHKKNNFRIIEYPWTSSPALFGIISPKILIPENISWTEDESYYILSHEMAHHFHHDLLLKNIIKIITLIYWWNPLGILLNREADVILEMRVDDSLTHHNATRTSEYLHCLLSFAEKSVLPKHLPSHLTMNLNLLKPSDFSQRFHLLINNQKKHSLALSLSMFIIGLGFYLGSYAFVLEANNHSSDQVLSSISDADNIYILFDSSTYLIDNGDGTYGVYVDGFFLENVDSLDYYPAGTPIYTPETAPVFDADTAQSPKVMTDLADMPDMPDLPKAPDVPNGSDEHDRSALPAIP